MEYVICVRNLKTGEMFSNESFEGTFVAVCQRANDVIDVWGWIPYFEVAIIDEHNIKVWRRNGDMWISN